MFLEYYRFKENPFSMLPDPAFLYLGQKHGLALAMLQYALMNNAIVTVLTGDIGAGKTTLIRHLLNQVDQDVNVGLLSNTHSEFGELMQWVNLSFGLPYENKSKVALYDAFVEFLISCYAKGQRTALIVDEAQNLDLKALEEFRLLSNVNVDKNQVLQLILVGQPELYRKLRRPELEQFIQRVSVSYHLKPLGPEETDKYISYRLSIAHGDPELFEARAKRLIHRQSGGVPRVINVLCETALVYGFADRRKTIDHDLVLEVIQDKIKGGLMQGSKRTAEEENGEGTCNINALVSPIDRNEVVAPGVFAHSKERSS